MLDIAPSNFGQEFVRRDALSIVESLLLGGGEQLHMTLQGIVEGWRYTDCDLGS
jgi:hypothetical protein